MNGFRMRFADGRGSRAPPAFSAALEVLEDRCLMAVDMVTNTNASGPGSLADTVSAAASGDTIQFASGVTGTITLNSVINIDKSLTIQGPGAGVITVSGGNTTQIFDVSGEGIDVEISGLTLTQGNAFLGGAIFSNADSLTLSNDVLSGNTASSAGGAVFATGTTLTVTDCTFSLNNLTLSGPTVFGEGAHLHQPTNTTLTNCTLEDNTATGNEFLSGTGGAVYSEVESSTLTLTDTTLADNTATGGGGDGGTGGAIYNNASTFTLTNCTLSGNTATGGTNGDGYGGAGLRYRDHRHHLHQLHPGQQHDHRLFLVWRCHLLQRWQPPVPQHHCLRPQWGRHRPRR